MSKIQNLTAFCLLTTFASCSSNPLATSNSVTAHRNPSSLVNSKNWEELRDLKQRRIELSAQAIHFEKKKNKVQLKKIQEEN